ncbi:MAG: hypothetical protein ACTHLH_04855 [Solirubrobacterales bacterium]
MSITIEKLPLTRFLLALLAVFALAGAVASASRAEITSTSECTEAVLSQHFLSSGDSRLYSQVPGQDEEGFNGEGWTLSGGASVVSTVDGNGQPVSALNLPSGSKAVSPTVCVTKDFPVARMRVRNLIGAEGVFFYVSYAGTKTWATPKNTGQVHGDGSVWTLSDPVNLQPFSVSGWQLVKFTLIPGGKSSLFQVYDFWTDPFARR